MQRGLQARDTITLLPTQCWVSRHGLCCGAAAKPSLPSRQRQARRTACAHRATCGERAPSSCRKIGAAAASECSEASLSSAADRSVPDAAATARPLSYAKVGPRWGTQPIPVAQLGPMRACLPATVGGRSGCEPTAYRVVEYLMRSRRARHDRALAWNTLLRRKEMPCTAVPREPEVTYAPAAARMVDRQTQATVSTQGCFELRSDVRCRCYGQPALLSHERRAHAPSWCVAAAWPTRAIARSTAPSPLMSA